MPWLRTIRTGNIEIVYTQNHLVYRLYGVFLHKNRPKPHAKDAEFVQPVSCERKGPKTQEKGATHVIPLILLDNRGRLYL